MKLKKFNIYKIFVLMVVTSATLFYACNQEEDLNIEENSNVRIFNTGEYNVKVIDHNLLSFETRADYENTIDYLGNLGDEHFEKWEREIGYTNSMRKQYSKDVLVNEKMIEDDLLATMLNAESMIQIENDLFKIDIVNEEVSVVTNSKLYPANNATVSFENQSARSYSTKDDVFDMMDGKLNSNAKRKYCKKSKIKKERNYNGDDSRIDWKIVYQNAGIYHSLQSKIKKEKQLEGNAYISLTSRSGSFWKNKKNYSSITVKSYGGHGREYNYRAYHKTRRLKDYYFSVDYYFTWTSSTGSGPTESWDDRLSISCVK